MESGNNLKQYVPILRWKAAEIEALAHLRDNILKQITPFFELCPPMFYKELKVKGRKVGKELRPLEVVSKKLWEIKEVMGDLPLYMDLVHVEEDKSPYACKAIWTSIAQCGKTLDLSLIPVTGFYGKGTPYQKLIGEIARDLDNGVCIRLFQKTMMRASFPEELEQLLKMLKHEKHEVDVLIDFQVVTDTSLRYSSVIQMLPHPLEWRSLSLAAGSFPPNLSYDGMKSHNTYRLPRYEWAKWNTDVLNDQDVAILSPRFSDFTIQHAAYAEPVDSPNVSRSIRYTCDAHWLIFRGEAPGDGRLGNEQYPAQAQLLISTPEYIGAGFSFGDEFIMKKSADEKHPGSVKDWLVAGINHHMTLTVHQLNPDLLAVERKETTPSIEARAQSLVLPINEKAGSIS